MSEIINRKYILQEPIGTGGMAHVYKAETVSDRKTVAVKLLKEEYLNDRELLRRFYKEGKASMHLHHNNIVQAYDVGEYNGTPFIVFEYVEGQTVEDIIRERGKLPAQEAIALSSQIMDALQYAHEHGIIHRDVKPQNVLVNSQGIAKLADFGIAREVSASTLTFDGKNVIGSVHYISPEQARGEAVSEASDIYSAGIALYEMLTGEVPFSGESAVATAIMQINNEPRPPRELEPEIPQALNAIVLKAIEKDPNMRYRHAKDMRDDLIRALSDPQGEFVTTEKAEEEPDKPRRKTDGLWIGILAAVFVPLLCLSVIYIGYHKKTVAAAKVSGTSAPATSEPTQAVLTAEVPITTAAPYTGDFTPESVAGLRLDEALQLLSKSGYTDIYVKARYDVEEDSRGMIVEVERRQSTTVLTVGRGAKGKYKADVSFTVDIPANDTSVMLVYKTSSDSGVDYKYVLYDETAVKEENVTVSASLCSSDEAARTVFLLLNGEEIRSQEVKFS